MTDKEMSMLTMGEEAEVNSNPSLSLPHTEKLHLALSFLTYPHMHKRMSRYYTPPLEVRRGETEHQNILGSGTQGPALKMAVLVHFDSCENNSKIILFHRLAEMENRNGSYVNENISPNESM